MTGPHHSPWAALVASDRVLRITSTANDRVRHIARMRDNRARRRAGEWITDGPMTTAAAIAAGWKLLGLYVREDSIAQAAAWPWASVCPAENCFVVKSTAMAKMAYGQTQSKVIGQFAHRTASIEHFRLPDDGIVLVLDHLEKPGNVGAIFRSADAAGVAAILLSGGGDPSHPNAIRNSRGAVMSLPTAMGTEQQIQQTLRQANFRVLAARIENSIPLDDCDLSGRCAIVLGNEAGGLGERWSEARGVHVPMLGNLDSLNVSVTAAIFAMEAARRKRQQSEAS